MLVNYKMFEDLEACKPALDWFKETFDGDVEFDSVYPLITDYGWIHWLMSNCNFAQTNEMLEHYKSLKPRYTGVRLLICYCSFARTNEMLEYYKSLKPSYDNVSVLIKYCDFAQTNEMLEYFISLKPSYEYVSWLINRCSFAKEYFERHRAEGVKNADG